MKKNIIISTILLILLTLSTTAVFAGEPKDYIKTKADAVGKLFLKPEQSTRGAEVEKLFEETIDLQELAAQSLEEEWSSRSEEEKQEFLLLLKKMLRANYERKLGKKKVKKSDYKVEYLEEKERGNKAFVKTKVTVEKETVPVDYRLLKKDKKWVIYDLVLDDVSLVETYKDGYKEIIKTEGWPVLIQRIKEKTAELSKGG